MTTQTFSISVQDELSMPHKITAITKCNKYDLKLVLDNGKAIVIDERMVMTHDLIPTESLYVVRITRG